MKPLARPPHHESGYAQVGNGRVYYELTGSGPPLVLLHPGLGHAGVWDEQVAAFSPHYRVLRYDAIGFYRSPPRQNRLQPVRDLAELLEQLAMPAAGFVGNSLGGTTAINFALEQPARTAALILVGSGLSAFPVDEVVLAQMEADRRLAAAGEFDRLIEVEIERWLPSSSPAVRAKVRQMERENLTVFSPDVEVESPEASPVGRLGSLAAPTLVVVGNEDRDYIKRIADALESGIPNCRRVSMPGGHLAQLDHPATFNRIVLEFLADIGYV